MANCNQLHSYSNVGCIDFLDTALGMSEITCFKLFFSLGTKNQRAVC